MTENDLGRVEPKLAGVGPLAFHHSMNYRSVMLFGRATAITGCDENHAALLAILDHMVSGRSNSTRLPTPEELRSTLVLRLPIGEASAKVRTGGPIDEAADYQLSHWAVIPLTIERDELQPDRAGHTARPDTSP